MPDLLPGYRWSRRAGRYRSNATGRFVARSRILELMEGEIDAGERELGRLTTEFHEGRLDASAWQEQMRTQLRRLHSQQSALGRGGWDRMNFRAWGRVGGKLQGDYRRLENFARDIENGDATLPQALNRAGSYANNAREQYWASERESIGVEPGNVLIERRLLTAGAEHCNDCLDLYERGWQEQGILPLPADGSTECLSNDKCRIDRREVPLADVAGWIGTKR